jgi:hypothetical protein
MGWNQRIAACTMGLICLSLFIRPASAAGIRHFTDSQGVIRITNQGEADQEPATPSSPPIFEGPRNKFDKLQTLGIPLPGGKPAGRPGPPASKAKTTPAGEENR